MTERCTFTFDLDEDPRGTGSGDTLFDDFGGEQDVWRCPRRRRDESDYCHIHAQEATDSEIAAAIRRSLQGEVDEPAFVPPGVTAARASRRFIGVELDCLDLSGRRFDTERTVPLDLRGSSIETLVLTGLSLPVGCRLGGSAIGSVEAKQAAFGGSFRCYDAWVEGPVRLDDIDCEGEIAFRHSVVTDSVSLRRARAGGRFDLGFTQIWGTVTVEKGRCRGRFSLKEAATGPVAAQDLVVSGTDPKSSIPGLQFRGLSTAGDLGIEDCEIAGTLIGYDLTVRGDLDASGVEVSDDVILGTVAGTAIALPNPTLDGVVDFAGAQVGGQFRFAAREAGDDEPTVCGPVILRDATLGAALLAPAFPDRFINVVDLRGATLAEGSLGQPSSTTPTYYDLTQTTLGTVSLTGGDRPATEYFWFDRTDFDGYRFDTNRQDVAENDWRLHDATDDLRRSIALGREYPRAVGLARDLRVAMLELPAVREWFVEHDPPYRPDACATVALAGLDETRRERLARNGPESERILGEAIFRRERYRAGVVTFLAREWAGQETLLQSLFAAAGEEIAVLARDLDAFGGRATGQTVDTVATQFARTLSDPSAIEPDIDEVQTTYIKARKGADDVGDSVAAAEFFVNELRFRRAQHRALFGEAERSRRRLRAASDYVWNRSFDLLAGYGERPRRVLAASCLVVVAFTGVFFGLEQLLGFGSDTYSGVPGAALLSLESFTSLVLGGTSVESRPVRFVANLQGFVGAFLIALLVFTLTRSLHR